MRPVWPYCRSNAASVPPAWPAPTMTTFAIGRFSVRSDSHPSELSAFKAWWAFFQKGPEALPVVLSLAREMLELALEIELLLMTVGRALPVEPPRQPQCPGGSLREAPSEGKRLRDQNVVLIHPIDHSPRERGLRR